MAAKQKRTYFIVEGSGVFPFDMLRYDQCFPSSEGRDSPLLDGHQDRRRVMLISDAPQAPTEGRWRSFNWKPVVAGGDDYSIEEWRDLLRLSPPGLFVDRRSRR